MYQSGTLGTSRVLNDSGKTQYHSFPNIYLELHVFTYNYMYLHKFYVQQTCISYTQKLYILIFAYRFNCP